MIMKVEPSHPMRRLHFLCTGTQRTRALSACLSGGLPGHDAVNIRPLLRCGFGQIDAGSLDAVVAQKVRQQGDIVVLLQKILGK